MFSQFQPKSQFYEFWLTSNLSPDEIVKTKRPLPFRFSDRIFWMYTPHTKIYCYIGEILADSWLENDYEEELRQAHEELAVKSVQANRQILINRLTADLKIYFGNETSKLI